jgi:hypothetical protein
MLNASPRGQLDSLKELRQFPDYCIFAQLIGRGCIVRRIWPPQI